MIVIFPIGKICAVLLFQGWKIQHLSETFHHNVSVAIWRWPLLDFAIAMIGEEERIDFKIQTRKRNFHLRNYTRHIVFDQNVDKSL